MKAKNITTRTQVRRNNILAVYIAFISVLMISFTVVTMLQHL